MQTLESNAKVALKTCLDGFVTAAAFSFFLNLLALVSPLYMMQVYNRVLPSRSMDTLWVLTALACGLLIANAGLEAMRSRILVRISGKLDDQLSDRITSAVFAASIRSQEPGSAQGIRDFDVIRQFFAGSAMLAFFDLPWSPLLIGMIFVLHPVLGALALAGAILLFGSAVLNELVTRRPLEKANRLSLGNVRAVGSGLRNTEVLHAMGMLPEFRRQWQGQRQELLCQQALGSDRAGAVMAGTKVLRQLIQIALLCAGAVLAIDNSISAGAIVASSLVIGRALAPFEQAIGAWKQLVAARESWVRLNGLLADYKPPPERTTLPPPEGVLEVFDLAVGPPGASTPTLRGVSFRVLPGQLLGITGPSGTGKSSLMRTLVGGWLPLAGKVRLDRADLHQWGHEQLGPHIGYIPQDVELFEGTIAQNIARFREGRDEDIIAAAKLAGVHEMILRMPEGYETPVGPSGRNLSAGQCQRVGLARAVYGMPALILLDEPNSNLDMEGDRALIEALTALKAQGRTVLMISHRPSVLQVTDLLLVLQPGGVRALGPRQAVLQEIGGSGSALAARPPLPSQAPQAAIVPAR